MAKRMARDKLFKDEVKNLEETISIINAQKEKELNAKIACDLLRLYFEEIAPGSLKRQLTLSDVVKAYKFAVEILEEKSEIEKKGAEPEKEPERISTLMEIKQAIEKPAKEEKPFTYVNKKGEKYYLHKKGSFYYFSKDAENAVPMPETHHVEENARTGMPIAKRNI